MPLHQPKGRPVLAPQIAHLPALEADPATLIDVGASGGIANFWDVFQPSFRAWGFDILLAEVARLNSLSSDRVSYHAARMGAGKDGEKNGFPVGAEIEVAPYVNPFARSSAQRHYDVTQTDYRKELYNRGDEVQEAERDLTIDAFCEENGVDRVDFIKIDTDGHDMEVLQGASETIDSGVLALFVECNFHGHANARYNLFTNVDLFLRPRGFSLFDIDVWRYSRADLPRRYIIDDFPAATERGQAVWCDALFVRDVAAPGYEDHVEHEYSAAALLKLCALLEIFHMEDCAVEILTLFADRIREQAGVDPQELAATLMKSVYQMDLSYDEFQSRFDRQLRSKSNEGLA